MIRPCLVVSLIVSLCAHNFTYAADVELYGDVKDAGEGAVIPGAKVTVFKESRDQQWQELMSTRTSANGIYEITKIPVGRTRLLFEKVPYKKEEIIVTLQTPPLRRELPILLIQLTASAPYFHKVGESKAAKVNDYIAKFGVQQAAALYRWEWYSCILGLSAYQTKLCADGLYGNVSTKVPKPAGIKPFVIVDWSALGAVDKKLGEGSTPTLTELQEGGIPPEVAWFTQWQHLQRSGASVQQIERNRKVLFHDWKLSDSELFASYERPHFYP